MRTMTHPTQARISVWTKNLWFLKPMQLLTHLLHPPPHVFLSSDNGHRTPENVTGGLESVPVVIHLEGAPVASSAVMSSEEVS